ncbi:hypothetical protein LINPERHAP2_LOCUS33401 [Linum perenne]
MAFCSTSSSGKISISNFFLLSLSCGSSSAERRLGEVGTLDLPVKPSEQGTGETDRNHIADSRRRRANHRRQLCLPDRIRRPRTDLASVVSADPDASDLEAEEEEAKAKVCIQSGNFSQQFSVFMVNRHLENNTLSGAIPSSVKLTGGRQDVCAVTVSGHKFIDL